MIRKTGTSRLKVVPIPLLYGGGWGFCPARSTGDAQYCYSDTYSTERAAKLEAEKQEKETEHDSKT